MIEKLLGLPLNASTHGAALDQLTFYVHLMMAVLFVGWMAFFLYTVFRFSHRRQVRADHDGVQSHATSYIEGVIVILELILLFAFSIPLWAAKVSAAQTDGEAVRVRVIAQQFAWNVWYPGPDGQFGKQNIKLVNEQSNPIGLDRDGDPSGKDDIVTLNQLKLPVNKPARLELTTKDVIHSFFLPLFRVKQDTIPGMLIPIHFTPTRTTDDIRAELQESTTREQLAKRNGEKYVARENITDAAGTVIHKKGARFTKTAMEKLRKAGVTTLNVAPFNPTEIACAQLCGLTHAKMVGYLTVLSDEDYQAWIAEELEALEE